MRLQSSIVTAVIAERRHVANRSLLFLRDRKVPKWQECAALAVDDRVQFRILEDSVVQTKVLWIEVVVVPAEVVLLTSLDRVVEDQWRSRNTLRRGADIASRGETGFNITASTVTRVRRPTETSGRATPGVVVGERTCRRICRIGDKSWAYRC